MYFGGKNGSGTYQTIINQIPPHDLYVEAFAGSGSIYRLKKDAQFSILIDRLNTPNVHLKNAMRPGSTYLSLDVAGNIDFFVGMLNFIHSNLCNVFCYCDPPYPLSSRKCQRRSYTYEMSDVDHQAFLGGMNRAHFDVAISTYPNDMYKVRLSEWRTLEYQSTTRCGTATELLYMNYPEPGQLHDYSFIGKDFREREKYKRVKDNVVRKFSEMPNHLRASILNALSEGNSDFCNLRDTKHLIL